MLLQSTSCKHPPKLLFLVTVDWFFYSHFLSRATAAQKEGYEVVVLTHCNRHRESIEAAGLRMIPLHIDRRSMNPFSAVLACLRILRVYRYEHPTIVHQVALKPILLGGIAARLSGVKHIVNAMVGGGYVYTSTSPLMFIARPVIQLALRVLLNPQGSRVIFENVDDLESSVHTNQVRASDAVLIRGAGVDPVLYGRKSEGSGEPVVILAARLLWDKGIGEFVRAAETLRLRGIHARFVVVGDSDPGNRACIDNDTLTRWRQEGIVELWGFRKDMPEVLAQASIACLPSYREGLPKFLLEAMATGLPCVTTDVPGCREAVSHEDNGLLVPARDAGALSNALERLLLDPPLRSQMGTRGRQRIIEEFSSTLVEKQTLALYAEVLAQ
ncbi:glycosyltransferase family 4 protein [Hydrogenophaga sp. PBL-H3]|nr:glycosyltransferase family 4 protein [Hydrogenophaga sp. PBL-H3]QHE82572.1 glycosyltransferase family 4 protein [Hydrogenophaga sp. PBL-H3]